MHERTGQEQCADMKRILTAAMMLGACSCYEVADATFAGMRAAAGQGQTSQPPPPRQVVTCTQTRSGNAVYTNCSDGSGCMTTYNGGQGFTTCH